MTRYLLANIAGLLLIACSVAGLVASAIALLDGWELVGATSPIVFVVGARLARLDAPAGGDV